MYPIATPSSVAKLDHDLIKNNGLSESALIESAALGVFNLTRSMIEEPVTVVAGLGNNGSDGIALASILHEHGYDVSILYLYEKGNAENKRRRECLSSDIPLLQRKGQSTMRRSASVSMESLMGLLYLSQGKRMRSV